MRKEPLIALPEDLMPNMVSPSNVDPYSGMDTGYGSTAVVNPRPPQRLDTMHRDSRGNFQQQQQPAMLGENSQTNNASDYFARANGTTAHMTQEASGNTNGTSRALHWQRDDGGTWAQAKVHVMDQIRDSMTVLWPLDLPLEVHPVEISTLNLQEWIRKNRAPVSRIKCAPGTDNHDFNGLVESLRNCGGYATACWEAGGSYQARLLLAPLGMDLLCVAFPVQGIPKPPTSLTLGSDYMKRNVAPSSGMWSRPEPPADPVATPAFPERPYHGATHGALIPQWAQPQQWTQPQAGYPPDMEPLQVDFNVPYSQATTLAPVRATSPPHVQPGQQAFFQAPLRRSNAQHSQQVATLTMPEGGSQLDDWQADAGTTGWGMAESSHGFDPNSDPWPGIDENEVTYSDANADSHAAFRDIDALRSSAELGLGDSGGGHVNGVDMYVNGSPSVYLEDDMERYVNWWGNGDD